jgi:ABC-type uncharacterized transport system permease subunit
LAVSAFLLWAFSVGLGSSLHWRLSESVALPALLGASLMLAFIVACVFLDANAFVQGFRTHVSRWRRCGP